MHGSLNASSNEFKNTHRKYHLIAQYLESDLSVYSKVLSYAINSAIKESCRIHTQREYDRRNSQLNMLKKGIKSKQTALNNSPSLFEYFNKALNAHFHAKYECL